MNSQRLQQDIVLAGGTLIDGRGGQPQADSAIVIRGQRIAEVRSNNGFDYGESAKVIDIAGKYILPGLIDIHVHYSDWMGQLFLSHGVTTVKDLGNDIDWISGLSNDIDRGKIHGPRILYVGNGLDAPPPDRNTHVGVTDGVTARRAVELLHSKGASAIKVREKMRPELLAVVAEESHKLGIPVTGHLKRTDAREAALAGIDGIEHLSGFVQAITNAARERQSDQDDRQVLISDLKAFSLIESSAAEELINLLVRRNVAVVPTMPIWWRMATPHRDDFAVEDANYAEDRALAYIPENIRGLWASSTFYDVEDGGELKQVQIGFARMQSVVLTHHQSGGEVLAGSDTFFSIPGLSLHRELMLLRDAGISPLEVVSIATLNNAKFLGKESELGTITTGKLADIVVVDDNPLDDIRNIKSVALVMKDGQIVDTSKDANYFVSSPKPKKSSWLEKIG
ncbi:MAG: amidohydrolase family protein [Pyrinomonadaceae bacterium]